ncbi:hypothetical protein BFP70_17205 [Thioclava sp. SK-1]|uniref:NTP transferase domain-containing protein n=1 Tax=Thioclava sp. SK-1 TaxID=1889770 RepID=UPI000826598A|nr:NTP transferase domain-containing protein [Thioclava sp. SK-1]OCX61178.1 hypothetical protein BFP70_17205 [Thioclava sp. SK-1]
MVLVVLAAGQSRRFGPDNKLLAPLRNRPLVTHAFAATQGLDAPRFAVVSDPTVAQLAVEHGLIPLTVAPGVTQSHSLRVAVTRATDDNAQRMVITLGDMPFVTHASLIRLMVTPTNLAACFQLNAIPLPPAVFPQSQFAALADITGDRGAGALLRAIPAARQYTAPAQELRDIDRPADMDLG